MENTKKVTKRDVLNTIMANVENFDFAEDAAVTKQDVIDYVKVTLEQMAHKNEKAAERSKAKRAEGDALREEVFKFVTTEPQTRDQIAKNFDMDVYSVAKIGARLTQLEQVGRIQKGKIKVGDRYLTSYSLAGTGETAPDEEVEYTEETVEI